MTGADLTPAERWPASFGAFIARARQDGQLVVQPRMGMSNPRAMRAGLLATKRAAALTVGTITLDSYTRVGDEARARAAVAADVDLNGYPITTYDVATTRGVLDGVTGPGFPVQVRHGSPCPELIFSALIDAGLDATEGGPVSYCLPYSRMSLEASVRNWARSCELLAALRETGAEPHLETFGGCMLGQLCPPSLLIAMSVLEALFFRQHGLRSISLSYAQQTNHEQDVEAVYALRQLAAQWLPGVDTHVVIYTYMGVYPRTPSGASALLAESARLAVQTGAVRLVVKTITEAYWIPSIADNVEALETAAAAAAAEQRAPTTVAAGGTGIYAEASKLIEEVVDLHRDLGQALIDAFRLGYLDIPYCLHPDNAGQTRSYIDGAGRLQWSRIGAMPLHGLADPAGSAELTASGLLASLSFVERRFDYASLEEDLAAEIQAAEAAGHVPPELKGIK
ncbi:MAG TPA: methylaspartate mutase [Streptosporangiaceae bacterium]